MANTRGSTASELPNLVTNRASHGFSMALIEIDGLPMFNLFTELKNGWIFHGKLLNNQRLPI